MAEGGPLIHGWQPVKIAVCCPGYEHVRRGNRAHYAEPTFRCDLCRILHLDGAPAPNTFQPFPLYHTDALTYQAHPDTK